MNDGVSALCDDAGPLERISGARNSGAGYQALSFEFANGTLHLGCDVDTDEVIVEVGETRSTAAEVDEQWATALLGKRIDYAWSLENHRGYIDGFQLRFYDDNRDEYYVQFEAMASTLSLRRVAPG